MTTTDSLRSLPIERLTLTAPQARALRALDSLTQADAEDRPRFTVLTANPKAVAKRLWPDSPGWERRTRKYGTNDSGALGGTMPMKAATLLWRLWERGLAEHDPNRSGSNGWALTDRGRAWLAAQQ